MTKEFNPEKYLNSSDVLDMIRELSTDRQLWIQRHIDAVWDEAHRVNNLVRELDGEFNK